ncbi:hypothetical protein NM208_g1397 [Fusarium decemcellulare]|uniref:Uncharacterized protein n=1 Tax=Fusarium decemcellulare TaxID=57161 RepID=A0ACC1SW86_9HYPO|nr:hypothetical protein NM208_g1397 [Fusarium decemcellulare]
MSSTGNAFLYTNLNLSKAEIRLLLLQPSTDPEENVQCSIQTVSLDDGPTFEALSYSWGDPAASKSIILDEQPLKVTLSAWTALRALRYHDRPRVLWVDAICINQSNPTEIVSQLKLMGAIYRKATVVRVWLGPDDNNNKDAIPILRAMISAQGAKDALRLSRASMEKVAQLRHFFALSWWERLWVVQEVALGRHVVLHHGAKELEYSDLLTAYHVSDAYCRQHLSGFTDEMYGYPISDFMEVFESVRVLNETRELCAKNLANDNESRIREATMTWTTVANLLRRREASVDKDRLYALYGLLPSTIVQMPGMEPAYSATTEDVYTNITYSIMEASKSLMMFNFVSRFRAGKSDGLPSWVPDWRLGPSNEHEANLRVAREHLFDSSLGTPFHLQRLSGNTICLKGFFVDVIHTSQCHPIGLVASPLLNICYESWRKTWANTEPTNAMLNKYMDGSSAETAFKRTMVWDCELGAKEGEMERLTPDEGVAMFEAYERAVRIALGDDCDLAGKKLSEEDSRRTKYMMNCAKDRAFFVTLHHLIGMTQNNVEAGDHIFIVAGNSYPVILRPSKTYADTWQAVSECYLHAFMDGLGVEMMATCAQVEQISYGNPAVKKLKGTERNPRQDEITEQPDGLWKWLLVE